MRNFLIALAIFILYFVIGAIISGIVHQVKYKNSPYDDYEYGIALFYPFYFVVYIVTHAYGFLSRLGEAVANKFQKKD